MFFIVDVLIIIFFNAFDVFSDTINTLNIKYIEMKILHKFLTLNTVFVNICIVVFVNITANTKKSNTCYRNNQFKKKACEC